MNERLRALLIPLRSQVWTATPLSLEALVSHSLWLHNPCAEPRCCACPA